MTDTDPTGYFYEWVKANERVKELEADLESTKKNLQGLQGVLRVKDIYLASVERELMELRAEVIRTYTPEEVVPEERPIERSSEGEDQGVPEVPPTD